MTYSTTRIPIGATLAIQAACTRLAPDSSPEFISIEPDPSALINKCIFNAERFARKHGGIVILGWKIYEWPRVLTQLIGHAVVHTEDGSLRCVTPDRDGESRILFLEDPSIEFDASDPMARMPSRLVPETEHQDVRDFIEVARAVHALKAKHPPTSGPIALRGDDAIRFQELQLRERSLLRDISLRTRKSTEPCICGSGRKFRKCCRPGMIVESAR